jgi:hypothetical protein
MFGVIVALWILLYTLYLEDTPCIDFSLECAEKAPSPPPLSPGLRRWLGGGGGYVVLSPPSVWDSGTGE